MHFVTFLRPFGAFTMSLAWNKKPCKMQKSKIIFSFSGNLWFWNLWLIKCILWHKNSRKCKVYLLYSDINFLLFLKFIFQNEILKWRPDPKSINHIGSLLDCQEQRWILQKPFFNINFMFYEISRIFHFHFEILLETKIEINVWKDLFGETRATILLVDLDDFWAFYSNYLLAEYSVWMTILSHSWSLSIYH